MKEAHAWLDLRASNTLIDGNLVASYMLKDLETHRNEVSIGSLEIWLEKNEMYYTVSEQLYLFLFGVTSHASVKPLVPLPVVQTGRATKTLLALPDVLLLNSKLPKRAQRWTLAYMLDSRSQNWGTFKQAIYGKGQTIIVIQDANGDIFGMYGSHKWFPSEGFFGNDECFLFTLKPDVNIYERSGRDNNFQLFTESGIGMGGRADRLGLFIQSDTLKGSTSLACSTFREFWPLGRELEFKITQLEVWAVDDEEVQVVERDIGKLICNTQYMRMRGDEMLYNEKITLKQTKTNKPKDVTELVVDETAEMPMMRMKGPLRCCGECGMSSQPKYQGRVCCSKLCKKKIKEIGCLNNPRGEGDGNAEVQTVRRYPRQEEERRLCQYRWSEEKVKMKGENRIRRISVDARQKHGAASGFIHPSLAAEENERNAKEAKESSPSSSIASKSNRSKTSKKYTSSPEQLLSRKSNSPPSTHNKTQVGESRLMKPSCRLYKPENKCACVVKTSCSCKPKEPSPRRSSKTYSIKTNLTAKEITSPERDRINVTAKTAKANLKTPVLDNDSLSVYACRSSSNKDFTALSSSTVLIEMIHSCPNVTNEPVTLSRHNSTASESNITANKSRVSPKTANREPVKKAEQPITETNTKTKNVKPESNSKKKEKEKVHEDKDKPKDKSQTYIKKSTTYTLQQLIQAELDCHCSSSTDCEDVEVRNKKCDPASMCCCEAKVSNYLTKMDRTDITGVPLSEISSSVCSCILDNKNKVTATPSGSSPINVNPSKKETQHFTKSRKKSDESSYYVSKDATKPKKTRTESPNSSFLSKRETQLLTKSRRASGTSTFSSVHISKQPPPVPPTCLRCRTLVSEDGCQCKAKPMNNEVTPTPLETSHLVQKEVGKTPLAMKNGGSRRSVVIDTEAMSFISVGPKVESDSLSLSGSTTSSRIINRGSSQSSQIKSAPKKSCKTSCKCSLSRSYFPVFPEDLIKEGGTLEDCDCASYNDLRFPVIIETPQEMSPAVSEKSQITEETDQAKEHEEQEIKDEDFGCDDNDNTIIILNVSKSNTAETVQKIIQELEVKAGEASNPNVKSLVFKCKDFSEPRPSTLQYSPCTSKSRAEREALRQQIEKILKRKSQITQPEPEEQEEQL